MKISTPPRRADSRRSSGEALKMLSMYDRAQARSPALPRCDVGTVPSSQVSTASHAWMAASSHAQHMLDNLDREQLIEKVCDALHMQNQLIAGSGAPLPASLQTLQTLDVEMSCSERRARQLLVEKSLGGCVPRWDMCNAARSTRNAWRQDEAARLDISTVDEVDLATLRDEVPHLPAGLPSSISALCAWCHGADQSGGSVFRAKGVRAARAKPGAPGACVQLCIAWQFRLA